MNVFTKITVSGFLLQGFFAGFPKFEKKKKHKTAKTYTDAQILVITISILIISQYSNIIIADENNDMTPTLNFIAS